MLTFLTPEVSDAAVNIITLTLSDAERENSHTESKYDHRTSIFYAYVLFIQEEVLK